jgi:type II secretory pathway predicted ATPase ExeA
LRPKKKGGHAVKRSRYTDEQIAHALKQAKFGTGGIPRLINMLCDTALLCAFAEDKQTVDTGDVISAVKELDRKNNGEYVRCVV